LEIFLAELELHVSHSFGNCYSDNNLNECVGGLLYILK
jgi:hypothetical protein